MKFSKGDKIVYTSPLVSESSGIIVHMYKQSLRRARIKLDLDDSVHEVHLDEIKHG